MAKTVNDIEFALWRIQKALEPRLVLLEDRADELNAAASAYDEATFNTQTADEEKHLARLMHIAGRASAARDAMAERVEKIREARALLEDHDVIVRDQEQAVTRRVNANKTARVVG